MAFFGNSTVNLLNLAGVAAIAVMLRRHYAGSPAAASAVEAAE